MENNVEFIDVISKLVREVRSLREKIDRLEQRSVVLANVSEETDDLFAGFTGKEICEDGPDEEDNTYVNKPMQLIQKIIDYYSDENNLFRLSNDETIKLLEVLSKNLL